MKSALIVALFMALPGVALAGTGSAYQAFESGFPADAATVTEASYPGEQAFECGYPVTAEVPDEALTGVHHEAPIRSAALGSAVSD